MRIFQDLTMRTASRRYFMRKLTKILSAAPFPADLNCPGCNAVETDRAAEALSLYDNGVVAKHIFLHADELAPEEIRAAQGKCRYLVRSPRALFALDEAMDGALPAGYLEAVGLCIGTDGFARDIPALSAAVRKTKNLTLRYVFLSLTNAPAPSLAAREAFSFVKQLRADVPCMLHGFCLGGLFAPLTQGDTELADTLQMLAALNDSSLYADFFIS